VNAKSGGQECPPHIIGAGGVPPTSRKGREKWGTLVRGCAEEIKILDSEEGGSDSFKKGVRSRLREFPRLQKTYKVGQPPISPL
jgi:hypothetical protein